MVRTNQQFRTVAKNGRASVEKNAVRPTKSFCSLDSSISSHSSRRVDDEEDEVKDVAHQQQQPSKQPLNEPSCSVIPLNGRPVLEDDYADDELRALRQLHAELERQLKEKLERKERNRRMRRMQKSQSSRHFKEEEQRQARERGIKLRERQREESNREWQRCERQHKQHDLPGLKDLNDKEGIVLEIKILDPCREKKAIGKNEERHFDKLKGFNSGDTFAPSLSDIKYGTSISTTLPCDSSISEVGSLRDIEIIFTPERNRLGPRFSCSTLEEHKKDINPSLPGRGSVVATREAERATHAQRRSAFQKQNSESMMIKPQRRPSVRHEATKHVATTKAVMTPGRNAFVKQTSQIALTKPERQSSYRQSLCDSADSAPMVPRRTISVIEL